MLDQKVYVIQDVGELKTKYTYAILKRLFDIVFSILIFAFTLIPMLVIMAIIKIDSKGVVIFSQERLGKNGKPFMIYKFRTMYVEAEKSGPQWAEKEDARCTKVGRLLRRTRLDELPQLWNIMKGEMSFVGPRPERAFFYDKFEEYITGFSQRMKVTPGLTGWAQVNGGYDLLPEEKIIFDMEYIKNRSLWMDLKCLFMTVKIVFSGSGSR